MDSLALPHVDELRRINLGTATNDELAQVLYKVQAGDFMAACVKILADGSRIPEHLMGIPGIGFWPTPMYFPLILARLLFLIESAVVELRLERDWLKARKLARVRQIFVSLSCGQDRIDGEQISDLSGDHCSIFTEDHPLIIQLGKGEEEILPWSAFCRQLLTVSSAFCLLGAIGDNEEGSIAEERALAETGLLVDGPFFRLHTIAEEEHAQLARQMEGEIVSEPSWLRDYLIGKVRHRILYAEAAGL